MVRSLARLGSRGRIGLALSLSFAVLLLAALSGVWGCHGHVIRRPYAPNHRADFDFSAPPCRAADRPVAGPEDVLLRYLGVGGLVIEWQGVSLMTAPLFTRYGLTRALLGDIEADERAIAKGLEGLDPRSVAAVLVGHGHYDHLGDLPWILTEHAVGARAYVNRSGANMLAAFPQLADRVTTLEDHAGRWIGLRDAEGRDLPLRILPLPSGHVSQLSWYHYGPGEVETPWTTWENRPLRAMKQGQPFAFLIDLLAEDGRTVLFRVHFQDAPSVPPLGFPPVEEIEERGVDLAVLCMASASNAPGYPQGLLERARARHALIGHYEDFFRSSAKPVRFVTLLTDGRAERFLESVKDEMERPPHAEAGPQPCTCGPCGAAWSMPLPGEWLKFRAGVRPGLRRLP